MKIGVIGAGNMSSAIVRGVCKSQNANAKDIWVSDRDASKLDAIKDTGVNTTADNTEVYKNCDMIVFAVKPNIYPIVLKEAAENGVGNKLVVSIAPGISTEEIESYFKENVRVIRTMPNTPAMVGEGMTVICCGKNADESDFEAAVAVFDCVGKTALLKEDMMDGVVAISGSSPAYVFMLIEAMADAGVQGGLMRSTAYELASQSVLGSARMVLETGKHPGELKDMVCSPGGTTIDAVAVLEKRGFRSAIIEAMKACTDKTRKMGSK